MKVVLFCGGFGMRMREYSESVPKPMVPVGSRPIIWHVMKYYAHYGHKDFILCLGYKGEVIKNYFRTYDETHSNDFVLSGGGKKVELLASDIEEGDDLEEGTFRRLISKRELFAYTHKGFWACMDTFKEQRELEDLYASGRAPWAVWNGNGKH